MLACGRLICCLAAAGLTAAYPSANGQGPNAVGDFSIPDVNPNSASFDTNVSPRDYLQQVSGWYFGHAT
jgi:hypothetical protein